MGNTRDPVSRYGYFLDNGDEHTVLLTSSVAAAGGFAAVTGASLGYLPGRMEKRHIGVVEQTSKQRHQIPIADINDTHYNTGGTITFGGETCDVVGRKGESAKLGSRTPP